MVPSVGSIGVRGLILSFNSTTNSVVEQTGIWESGIRHGPKGTQIGKVKGVSRRRSRQKDTQTIDKQQHTQLIYYLKKILY